MNRVLASACAVGLAVVLTGCGTSSQASNSAPRTVTVFAAASLKKTFTELGRQFEAVHPGAKVALNFAGSSDLVTQIQQGAPADVFASADTKNMAKATNAKLVAGEPTIFASNTLQIAVPPKNPKSINSLSDLTRSGLKVVICAPQVPCGSATKNAEAAAKVTLKPVSEESSVTDVLNKVVAGEADAGLVYRTDVLGTSGKVNGVNFSASSAAVNKYPIAVLAGADQPELSQEFVAIVTGPAGRKVLAAAGFGTP